MLEIRKGDIFLSECEAICNAVNCIGVMGAGLALQFKRCFPEMFEDYKHVCNHKLLRPGTMHVWDNGSNPRFIINFPTKDDLSPSQMSYITSGLLALAEEIKKRDIKSIAIPSLGCGLGGLPYEDVKLEIEKFVVSLPDIQVVLYEPL
jgi:O-acetyl-ADP-ribose deacetylase (regulator of RNase III)